MDYDYVQNNGMTSLNPPTGMDAKIVIVFFSVALFNVLELLFIIYTTFKRRTGLYFWSFIVATVCIIPYSVGFMLKFFGKYHDAGMVWAAIIYFGWCGMVTGQSLVLWSRLHLVMYDRRRQRAVLIMIIVDAIICHGGVSVLIFGVNSKSPKSFVQPYAIFERVQLTIFSIQEITISSLYIYETAMLLRREKKDHRQSGCDTVSNSSGGVGGEGRRTLGRIGYAEWRRVLKHLVYISILIILLDMPLLALQYADLYDLQTSYKALLYSVKLKLEFSILKRLIEVTTEHNTVDAGFEFGFEMGAGGSRGARSSSRNLRGMSPPKTTPAKSPRQAYEETLAQLRSETPPPVPSAVGLERLNLEQEQGPDRGRSSNMRINVAAGNVDGARMVKFHDGQVGGQDEEDRGFPLTPFEAMAFRFDDEVETRPRRLQRTDSSVSGENSQSEQNEQRESPRSFGHQRRLRSDEGAYLRNLDEEAIELPDMTEERLRPTTEPLEGPVFTRSRDLI
ncbi:hypothetical protein PpBr36_04114 [Pyricularia pennisetigena]|uniref:hypothetical protein n=1 Tax=Pyricularia pennisetigena TaxID=1578925 RepID=UPI00114FDE0C|nr:hypothetical protein PpBr36_04114 [Pyricularia pennisetigena]TLS26800.1 hypothetical protein PpBr36_04114 [Pyricularia pennisetigena]